MGFRILQASPGIWTPHWLWHVSSFRTLVLLKDSFKSSRKGFKVMINFAVYGSSPFGRLASYYVDLDPPVPDWDTGLYGSLPLTLPLSQIFSSLPTDVHPSKILLASPSPWQSGLSPLLPPVGAHSFTTFSCNFQILKMQQSSLSPMQKFKLCYCSLLVNPLTPYIKK